MQKRCNLVSGQIRDTADFIEAVKAGGTWPAVHTKTGYDPIDIYDRLQKDKTQQH